MLSLWALIDESDVEAYAGTLVLPAYLAHLRLEPFRFARQPSNRDGREALVLTYVGRRRLEEYRLEPKQHALGLVCAVCPDIAITRLGFPQDDAAWSWSCLEHAEPSRSGGVASPQGGGAASPQGGGVVSNPGVAGGLPMRVYFGATAETLGIAARGVPSLEAFVSVSRGEVFVPSEVLRQYIQAWLAHLGIRAADGRFDFLSPSGGIDFVVGKIGGQLFIDDGPVLRDILQFAGLDRVLEDLTEFVAIDGHPQAAGSWAVTERGFSLSLQRRAD